MRTIVGLIAGLEAVLAAGLAAAQPVEAIPIENVVVTDSFWAPRIVRNREITIPHILAENEKSGRVANFERAAHRLAGAYEGRRFNDTDVYKAIEAASYTLIGHPDAALEKTLDDLIAVIAAAQEPDGYLFPARTVDPVRPAPGIGMERWIYLNGSHELYNAGHLYEAAVAHFRATGKSSLLDVATRNADLVCRTLGPSARRATSGHEEIELALVRLSEATGNEKYLQQARFFLEERGRPHETTPYPPGPFEMYNDASYRQDDIPVAAARRAEGHAVRAMYLYSAMSDIARRDGSAPYATALGALWNDVLSHHLYLTGSVGARDTIEGFGDAFELPNRTAYGETCASVGNILWNFREFLRTGDAKHLDLLERVLYNGFLSGVSLSGDRFFYTNPLESAGDVEREAYFEVACCPANLSRLIAQLPGMLYGRSGDALVVNLYAGSRTGIDVRGTRVDIRQATSYPWDGRVRLSIEPENPVAFPVRMRIPAWAGADRRPDDIYRFEPGSSTGGLRLLVNNRRISLRVERGFAVIERQWKAGDRVELDLPMPILRVHADARVAADSRRVALQRGPIVYCLEGPGNGGHVLDLEIPAGGRLSNRFEPDLLGGVEIIRGQARRAGQPEPFTAIPYFAWANRGKSEMAVWVREAHR